MSKSYGGELALNEYGFARNYHVELLYDKLPVIGDELQLKLHEHCGKVDLMTKSDDSKFRSFAFLDYPVEYQDGKVPVQCFVALNNEPIDFHKLEPAIQQSWGWSEARSAVSNCRCSVVISDFLASGLSYDTRLDLFYRIISSFLELYRPSVIHWTPSFKLINPDSFVLVKDQSIKYDPLQIALNVRLFNIENDEFREAVMDSVGLAAIGLPDLQCHFKNIDPNEIARILYSYGHYLFNNGDLIEDGNTIEGFESGQRWICQHEMSMIQPKRVVLDINPGPPYTAGNR